jgi:hypothetical protein
MALLSYEVRAINEFVLDYAQRAELSDEAIEHTTQRYTALIEWLKTFRRGLHYAARYPDRHPARHHALKTIVAETKTYLRAFGPLALRFGPGASFTMEGMPMPAAEGELEARGYTFYPLFRDGVIEIQIKPGVPPEELAALLDICGHDGRRDGDDVITWMWSERFKKIRTATEPALTPHVAAALSHQADVDPVLSAYLDAWQRTAPTATPLDKRPKLRPEHAEHLRPQGLRPELVSERLSGTANEAAKALSPESMKQYRREFESPDERRTRLMRASQRIGNALYAP